MYVHAYVKQSRVKVLNLILITFKDVSLNIFKILPNTF